MVDRKHLSQSKWRNLAHILMLYGKKPDDFSNRKKVWGYDEEPYYFMSSYNLRCDLRHLLSEYIYVKITSEDDLIEHRNAIEEEVMDIWAELVYREKVEEWLCRFDILTRTGMLQRDIIMKIIGEKPR